MSKTLYHTNCMGFLVWNSNFESNSISSLIQLPSWKFQLFDRLLTNCYVRRWSLSVIERSQILDLSAGTLHKFYEFCNSASRWTSTVFEHPTELWPVAVSANSINGQSIRSQIIIMITIRSPSQLIWIRKIWIQNSGFQLSGFQFWNSETELKLSIQRLLVKVCNTSFVWLFQIGTSNHWNSIEFLNKAILKMLNVNKSVMISNRLFIVHDRRCNLQTV